MDKSRTAPSPSLTGRLLRGLLVPMIALALALGFGGALVIQGAVETVSDRILRASSRAIAESLAIEDGEVTLDLPPAAFGMLENNARDNVYYSIRHGRTLLTGYPDLPNIASARLDDGEAAFATIYYRGQDVRVVAEGRRLPRIPEIVVVQVAESMEARERIAERLMIGLIVLEGTLILISALMIPLAVRWGLLPLARLRAEMDRRVASDFTPLPYTNVPSEMRELVGAFNMLLARLDKAAQGMRRFAADASHQMRTPLSIVRTHVAVLRKAEPGSEESRTSINDIDQAADRLQHLLVQLLALARADSAASTKVDLQEVDLLLLVRETAAGYAGQALRAKVDLAVDDGAQSALVRTQPTLAAELIGNFLDNAIKYNRTGGCTHISITKNAGSQASVIITDDGPGIPAADRERVFSRFTRLEASRVNAGSGLGLSIAQSLAEAIGAQISLDAGRDGQGLEVTVTFPSSKRNDDAG